MLVLSEQRLYPPMINIITLQKDDMYFYVDRNLYDQAVILNYKFKSDLKFFKDIFGEDFTPEVNKFLEEAPEPINILAPYLLLIQNGDLTPDLEMITGALHQIFSVINALQVVTVPAEVRATIAFSLSIYEEFRPSWESFFYACDGNVSTYSAPVKSTSAKSTSTTSETSFETSYDLDMDGWDLDLDADDEEEEEAEEEVTETAPTKQDGLDFLRKAKLI